MPRFVVNMDSLLLDVEVEAEDGAEALSGAIESFQDWASDESNYSFEQVPE